MPHDFSLGRFRQRLKSCGRDSGDARLRQIKSSGENELPTAKNAGGFAIRCGHQVRRAFALMAATVSLPRNRRNAGRTSASRKKGQKKVLGKRKS
ncbi:hypothetical protein FFR93_15390 [Rhizobium sp. MHM7A]|nr:hypothetical protein FFR93_15390 [Rhizobium sp. MHM7A]